jgi:hypothetical protein
MMEHDLPEWIQHIRLRFTSERSRLLNEPLPKHIIEALAALEDAERSGERVGKDTSRTIDSPEPAHGAEQSAE